MKDSAYTVNVNISAADKPATRLTGTQTLRRKNEQIARRACITTVGPPEGLGGRREDKRILYLLRDKDLRTSRFFVYTYFTNLSLMAKTVTPERERERERERQRHRETERERERERERELELENFILQGL